MAGRGGQAPQPATFTVGPQTVGEKIRDGVEYGALAVAIVLCMVIYTPVALAKHVRAVGRWGKGDTRSRPQLKEQYEVDWR